MAKKIDRGEILQKVKKGELSPEEGTALLKSFYKDRKENYDILYYKTAWNEVELLENTSELMGPILLFDKNKKLSDALRKAASNRVILIKGAKKFKKINDDNFEINLESGEDYRELAETCSAEGAAINIVYNRLEEREVEKAADFEGQLPGSLYSMLHLTQALMKAKIKCRVNLLFIHNNQIHFSALSGFAKTLNIENPRYNYHIAAVDVKSRDTMAELITGELLNDKKDYEIEYRAGKRFVKGFAEVEKPSAASSTVLKEGGVYLLTGGAGGLGLLFATFLAKNYKARLVLTGRSKLNSERKKKLEKLKESDAEVVYIAADISKAEDVERLVKEAKEQFGKINGVLHCAGLNRDSYIMKKTVEEMQAVLAPKMRGTLLLDEALTGEKLDFFVLFSSIAASLGNAGQADYSYANSFLDYYATQSKNRTLSINWPLWESGGMQVDSEKAELLERSWGMVPLRSRPGLEAFVNGLELETEQLLVVEGDRVKLNKVLGVVQGEAAIAKAAGTSQLSIASTLKSDMVEIVSKILKVKEKDIDTDDELNDFGFDSVSLTHFANAINDKYKTELTPALFFEYTTLSDVMSYLLEEHGTVLQNFYKGSVPETIQETTEVGVPTNAIHFIHKELLSLVSDILHVNEKNIDFDDELHDYGFDSVSLTHFANAINDKYKTELTPAVFFEYTTLSDFSNYLNEEYNALFQMKSTEKEIAKSTTTGENATKQLQDDLIKIVSHMLGVKEQNIDVEDELDDYGFDSVSLTHFANTINERFQTDVTPAIFFEYSTLDQISEYLLEKYNQTFNRFYQLKKEVEIKPSSEIKTEPAKKRTRFTSIKEKPTTNVQQIEQPSREDIAIVGISGMFPGSPDLESYWKNLEAGNDMIKEVPKERWNWEDYLENGSPNKTSRWGGFIDDIDKFDPLFFNISPREAELMDPQHRLFLETVWKAIEDSGHKPTELSGTKTGLFVGVSVSDYSELMVETGTTVEAQTSTGNVHAVLPNRISYLLNIHGPSEPVDTACSSALVAVHRAIMSIQSGESEMAIAGGVHALLTPKLFIAFSKAGMMSPDGRCKTFDSRANGYVRGEGVGAIFMKPLSKALADNDRVYAVIKGSAVNHGGHAKSLTAPNPSAQAELLLTAYRKAGFDPATVSFIEAHGTGTPLGDPIEINGLKKAFTQLYSDWNKPLPEQPHCGLSSAKTNIGHLEAAAGIAGLLKIILAMKYQKIPGNSHFKELNPYIQLEKSPFYIIPQTKAWQPLKDELGNTLPRRAGVSSFGFGGVNSHVVLEEFVSREKAITDVNLPVILPLSAKNDERLKEYTASLLNYVENKIIEKSSESNFLIKMAYTLQMGRTDMESRLAVVAGTISELKNKLKAYLEGQNDIEGVETGKVVGKRRKSDFFIEGNEGREFINIVIKEKNYIKLAQLWTHGIMIDWNVLYSGQQIDRLNLPTYPFEKKRYWIDESKQKIQNVGNIQAVTALHPLVGSNVSTLQEQCFSTQLSGSEFFLNDHLVGSDKVLPGVTYLEMARAAGSLATGETVTSIKGIIWARPIVVGSNPVESYISFYPSEPEAEYEVWSLDEEGERVLNSQGKIGFDIKESVAALEIEQIKSRCNVKKSAEQCYSIFKKMNLNYGPGFQGIKELSFNENEALALLEIPAHLQSESSKFMLPPTIMDGALQAVVGLLVGNKEDISSTFLPFALGEVVIHKELNNRCYAYVTSAGSKMKYDIAISDEAGNVLVNLKGFAVREFKQRTTQSRTIPTIETDKNLYYYTSEWQKAPLTSNKAELKGTTLIFDFDETLSAPLSKLGKTILVKPGKAFNKINQSSYEITPESENDYNRLIKELIASDMAPANIIHCWSHQNCDKLPEYLDEQLNYGAYSLFILTKALMSNKLKDKVKLLYLYNRKADNPAFSAMSGFVKTVNQENGKYYYKAIGLDLEMRKNFINTLLNELSLEDDNKDLIYKNEERFSKSFIAITPPAGPLESPLLKKGGIYLITGGTGGLGLVFAKYLAENVQAKLILTGRSKLNDKKKEEIATIEASGSKVIYIQNDITSSDDVNSIISRIKNDFGQLNGIIHAAGLLRDSFIIKKSFNDFKAVANPKVLGTTYLDEATKNESLDFFMLFSSLSGSTGNPGQCDYSYSNCFMDDFASLREEMRKDGKRKGKTISVNWPLWEEGGMNVDDKTREYLKKTAGMVPLRTAYGLEAFEKALLVDNNHVVVVEGDKPVIDKKLGVEQDEVVVPQVSVVGGTKALSVMKDGNIKKNVENQLAILCSKLLKVEVNEIDNEGDFADYGIDSILMMEMMNKIEAQYGGTIDPNVISEHSTIKSLATYLIEKGIANNKDIIATSTQANEHTTSINTSSPNLEKVKNELLILCSELLKVEINEIDNEGDFSDYGIDSILMMEMMNKIEAQYGDTIEPNTLSEHSTIESLAAYLIEKGIVQGKVPSINNTQTNISQVNTNKSSSQIMLTNSKRNMKKRSRFVMTQKNHFNTNISSTDKRIAVVSIACRFPKSDSPESFWNNLKTANDLITEIPSQRWKIDNFFSKSKEAPGKSYSKWAGFIENIDLFDADFFGYSDNDALVMDPQHRLLLELSQELLDRGGYNKKDITKSITGVFLGGTESSYVEKNMDKVSDKEMKHVMVNKIQNMMAARISDFYDLKGASFTVDTACSSSLVAIHQACQNIITGECSMAIAGGIELILDEVPHIGFSKSGALSDGPHSYVFDERAKGFVLGEGAGLVLLKSYEQAIADGDRILGTILGSAVNNDGHTMGLTVPSQEGQKAVIQQAINKSGITPDTISYLEAHGTGTLLGDPIEIKAAGQVYKEYTEDKQYCAVGAVKSNMGHALHAAGVAGLIKILLAMEHKYIPPTLHCEKPHPRFKFEESPFYPVLKGKKWAPYKGVRRAAISSFGFGGTNAHLIIEEAPQDYQSSRKPLPPTQFRHKRYWLGKEIVEVDSGGDKELYKLKDMLIKLSNGELTPSELVELDKAGRIIK